MQVEAQSTNYQRTARSAQFFLHGLLSGGPVGGPVAGGGGPSGGGRGGGAVGGGAPVRVPVRVPAASVINPFDAPPGTAPECLWARVQEVPALGHTSSVPSSFLLFASLVTIHVRGVPLGPRARGAGAWAHLVCPLLLPPLCFPCDHPCEGSASGPACKRCRRLAIALFFNSHCAS